MMIVSVADLMIHASPICSVGTVDPDMFEEAAPTRIGPRLLAHSFVKVGIRLKLILVERGSDLLIITDRTGWYSREDERLLRPEDRLLVLF